jgi:NCAIR mutase (PurE)-related protein
MDPKRLRALLDAVAAGEVSAAEAAGRLAELPYADLGFAKLDLHRELRGGLPEAVFAEGKEPSDLLAIAHRLHEAHGRLLVTRLDPGTAAELLAAFPSGRYHRRARVLTVGEKHPGAELGGEPAAGSAAPALASPTAETASPPELLPRVAVVAAGTSDLAVAEEAAVCAEWAGLAVDRHFDVGVAGLHRLLDRLPALRRAAVVIAVAGMDGALPAVVAGLLAAPVVAVPTSVGYGTGLGGGAALLTMLNACSPGVGVVNIDNGFGAALLAARIVRAGGGTAAAAEGSAPEPG